MRRLTGIAFAIGVLFAGQGAHAQSARPVIASEADLPPTRFPMPELPSEVIMTDAFIERTLPLIRAEAERILANYDVRDPSIAGLMRAGLASIAWLEDRPEDAIALTTAQRAAETKPQLRAIGQMLRESFATGLSVAPAQRCAAVAQHALQMIARGDPLLVRDEVLLRYGQVQLVSPAYHIGSAALIADPEAKAQGSIGVLRGLSLANMRFEAEAFPACRSELTSALQSWTDDPAHRPIDIWTARADDGRPCRRATCHRRGVGIRLRSVPVSRPDRHRSRRAPGRP